MILSNMNPINAISLPDYIVNITDYYLDVKLIVILIMDKYSIILNNNFDPKVLSNTGQLQRRRCILIEHMIIQILTYHGI